MHSAFIKVFVVNLAVNHSGPSPLTRLLSFIEVAQVGIVTETADEMEAILTDAVVEGTVREESVCHDEVRQLQQFLAVTLNDSDVVLRERLVAHLQF